MVSTYNPNPPGNGNTRWWLEDWTGGSGRDYQNQSFEEAYREFLRQSQQPPPQQSNEGQTVTQPQDPTGTAQDPVFSTDVWGNNQPLQTIGSNIGDPTLNQYLASLPGGGQAGSTGGNYQTYFTGDLGSGDTGGGGGGNTNTYFTDPPAEERGNTYTYFSDPSMRGDYNTYFAPAPTTPPTTTRPPINGPVITTPPRETPTETFPPIRTNPQPQQPGQQPQQPGVGPLLAALPMLAAFQGGTTTTPAPYAHLGPHTPVAPVFKPQGRGNPIPSIGQLLEGVR